MLNYDVLQTKKEKIYFIKYKINLRFVHVEYEKMLYVVLHALALQLFHKDNVHVLHFQLLQLMYNLLEEVLLMLLDHDNEDEMKSLHHNL